MAVYSEADRDAIYVHQSDQALCIGPDAASEFAARGRDMDSYRPPGGESFADCLARAWPLWKSITNTDAEAIAIVAHAGVNRLLLCRLLGMPVQNMFRLGQDYGCVNVVEVERRNIRVRLINGRCANLDD